MLLREHYGFDCRCARCVHEQRRDLKARDGAPADVVAALDGLAAVAAATPIDVDAA